MQLSKLQSYCNPRFESVVLWPSAALTELRLVTSDLQLLNHVPAGDRSSVVWRSGENHYRFLSFSDDSCDFSDDSCHFCTPPPYFYVVNMSSIPPGTMDSSIRTDTPFSELFSFARCTK